MNLTEAQSRAIDNFRQHAKSRKENAVAAISHYLKMSNIRLEDYQSALDALKMYGRVALHFHPDRLDQNLKNISQSLFEGGVYKSQFEAGLSNGSVSAHPGGERDLWEQKMFSDAYTFDNSESSHRPKYGALDIMLHSDGPSPRFGSCYFLLRPEIKERCTFTYLDSHQLPQERGTIDEFDDITAELFSEVFSRNFGLGENGISIPTLILHLKNLGQKKVADRLATDTRRNLDHYIESQIHGDELT